VVVLGLLLVGLGSFMLGAALMWLRFSGTPTTVTLTEPAALGELLHLDDGERTRTYVVRRVMQDLTRSYVVAVRPYRRRRWARRSP
jgi:hypothetical protein